MRSQLLAAALLALVPLTGLAVGLPSDAGADPGPYTGERLFVLVMEREHFNGQTWPSTPLLEAYEGERMRFVVHTLSGGGMHTFHLHGHPWEANDEARFGFIDAIRLDGGETHDFTARAGLGAGHAGDWFYHCHVTSHFGEGMWGLLRVYPYAIDVEGPLDELTLTLVDDGEGLEGASFQAHLREAQGPVSAGQAGQGESVDLTVEEEGDGRYTVRPDLADTSEGQLVLTANHERGQSVARLDLTAAGYELSRDVVPEDASTPSSLTSRLEASSAAGDLAPGSRGP